MMTSQWNDLEYRILLRAVTLRVDAVLNEVAGMGVGWSYEQPSNQRMGVAARASAEAWLNAAQPQPSGLAIPIGIFAETPIKCRVEITKSVYNQQNQKTSGYPSRRDVAMQRLY
jgi:hypothetical protein